MPSEIRIPNLINIKDEGVSKGFVDSVNFVGNNVSVSVTDKEGTVNVTGKYSLKNIVMYTTPGSGTYNPPSDVEALLIIAVGGGGGGGGAHAEYNSAWGGLGGGGAGGCGIKFMKRPFSQSEWTMSTFASASTNGGNGTALARDSNGNLYWATMNNYNGSTYNLTSYVYKITPQGNKTTFASVSTMGAGGAALIWGPDGNLYWAVTNKYNGSTYNLTSYVYKITPGGTRTTFASAGTNGATGTALAFDSSGNLYWAVSNQYNGSTYNLTSYVYKITPGGTMTTFASASTSGSHGTSLLFDSSGNLYWAVGNSSGLTSYVYKITPSGTMTTFASANTSSAYRTALAKDSGSNLYWAVTNFNNGSTYNLTSYVYKITPSGTMTTFASVSTSGAAGTALSWDPSGNLYWAVGNHYNGSTYNITSYVYKITPGGTRTTFASAGTNGAYETALSFDSNGDLCWAVANYYNGSYNLTGYVYKIYQVTVTSFPYTVGAGGAGGSPGNSGSNGGNTTIAGMVAGGGNGGNTNPGSFGGRGGKGGLATGGDLVFPGNDGKSGGSGTTSVYGSGGGGGNSVFNGAGRGGGSASYSGRSGSFGGGGGGGTYSGSGGNGGAGTIVIYEFG